MPEDTSVSIGKTAALSTGRSVSSRNAPAGALVRAELYPSHRELAIEKPLFADFAGLLASGNAGLRWEFLGWRGAEHWRPCEEAREDAGV